MSERLGISVSVHMLFVRFLSEMRLPQQNQGKVSMGGLLEDVPTYPIPAKRSHIYDLPRTW